MSSIKQLYSQSLIYGLSTVLPRLLNYLLVPIHTNVLTNPIQYGIITEFYAYITFLLIFLTFGLETGYFRFINKYKNDESVYSNIFTFVTIISTLFLVLTTIYSKSIANILGKNYLPLYINTTAAIVTLDSITAIPFAKLRNNNRPIVFSFIKISGVVINILFNLFFYLYLKPETLKSLIPNVDILYFVFLSNLIQNIFVFIMIIIFTGIPCFNINKKLLKEILIYSLPLFLAGLSGTANEAFDRIFIKYLIPRDQNALYQLGIYGANVKLAVLLLLFVQMYKFAAEPFFFKTQNQTDHIKLFGKSLKYFIFISIIITIAITFNIPLLKFFVGKNYRESLFIIPILLIANTFYGIYYNLSFWFKLTDKTIYGVKYVLIGSFSTITLNIILIPIIGIYGAATSRMFTYILMTFLNFIDGRKSGYISIEKENMFFYLKIIILVIAISSLLLLVNKQWISLIIANISIIIILIIFVKKEKITIRIWK